MFEFAAAAGGGASVTAGYDSLGRVSSLTRADGANTTIVYDAADRTTSLAHALVPTPWQPAVSFRANNRRSQGQPKATKGPKRASQGPGVIGALRCAELAPDREERFAVASISVYYDALADR